MSKLNIDDYGNNENVDYQIQCIFDSKVHIVYGIVIILCLSALFGVTFTSDYFLLLFISLVWYYPLGFFAIYRNLKKCKKENIIITLVHKEDAEVAVGEGTTHFYY